ncbi:MAG: hypothetical protein BMS9Abin07_0308 [Acidimicrobiia bacterium]|nr:MAG: hypothetical protein BMS9Abin07_0308 [Acidimicrobiia bacterium]
MIQWLRNVGRGRWWRWPMLVAGAYVLVTIVANVAVFGSVLGARAAGFDERITIAGLQIMNFREVDDRLLVGAQPTGDAFERLAAMGVTTVVDLRTGAVGDPILDDPQELAALGIEYVAIPLDDGRAPDAEMIQRFLAVMEQSNGRVYLHCGGGVGRSTAFEMAYRAATGLDYGVPAQLAIGPPTIEQLYFVSRLSDDRQEGVGGPIVFASRAVDLPRALLTWLRGTVLD